MPSIEEINEFVEKIAPLQLCEEWDNSGLLINSGKEINKILVALDITNDTVDEAIKYGCNLIVSHHPIIFKALKAIDNKDVVFNMIKEGISAICAHTNLDVADGGVNDILAQKLGLVNMRNMLPFGKLGELEKAQSPAEFAKLCTRALGTSVFLASASKNIKNVAVIGGRGDAYICEAKRANADCLVTGEAMHHKAIDAVAMGMSLIAAGHFETEYPMVHALADMLKARFTNTEIFISKQSSPLALYNQQD